MRALLKRIFGFLFTKPITHVDNTLTEGTNEQEPTQRLNSEEQVTVEHAPCPGGYHTTYMLFRRAGSKEFIVFPEYNFKLTTHEWQEETLRKITEAGFKLQLKGS